MTIYHIGHQSPGSYYFLPFNPIRNSDDFFKLIQVILNFSIFHVTALDPNLEGYGNLSIRRPFHWVLRTCYRRFSHWVKQEFKIEDFILKRWEFSSPAV